MHSQWQQKPLRYCKGLRLVGVCNVLQFIVTLGPPKIRITSICQHMWMGIFLLNRNMISFSIKSEFPLFLYILLVSNSTIFQHTLETGEVSPGTQVPLGGNHSEGSLHSLYKTTHKWINNNPYTKFLSERESVALDWILNLHSCVIKFDSIYTVFL